MAALIARNRGKPIPGYKAMRPAPPGCMNRRHEDNELYQLGAKIFADNNKKQKSVAITKFEYDPVMVDKIDMSSL